MSSKLSVGMVKMWEQTLDESVADVMAKAQMVRARNRVLAKYDIETQMGVPALKAKMAKAEEQVKQIEEALHSLGVTTEFVRSNNHAIHEARARFGEMVTAKAKEYDDPAVAEFFATVSMAKERVRLAMLPTEVRTVLEDVREVTRSLAGKIAAIDHKTAKLIQAKKIEEE